MKPNKKAGPLATGPAERKPMTPRRYLGLPRRARIHAAELLADATAGRLLSLCRELRALRARGRRR